ncbi:hypothetical protein HKX48_003976 [Thoreauomyces humboldtii]|nr:hypothetical protein HKX48_003976 [Thoreauomyces humboldtii]
MNDPSNTPLKPYRRKHCCCFPSRKACCLTFLIPLIGILIAVAILIWWFWPTVPQYGHGNVFTPSNKTEFAQWLPTDSKWTPGIVPILPSTISTNAAISFELGLGISVWVANNQNRFNIDSDTINVIGTISSVNGTPIAISRFNLTIDMINVNFGKGTNTTVEVPLSLNYGGTLGGLVSGDPVFQLLASSCNQQFLTYTPSGTSPPLVLDFTIDVAPNILRFFKKTINIHEGPISVACPDEMKQFLADFNGQYGPILALGLSGI